MSLIIHVDNNKLIRRILEPEQLWDGLVTGYVHCWEVDTLFNMPLRMLIWLSQIKKQEGRILCDAEHVSRIGHMTRC